MDWQFVEANGSQSDKFSIFTAACDSDYQGVENLWRTVYGDELGWLAPASDALCLDRFHEHSAYLLAMVDGHAAGTMRLVRDSTAGLPIEQFADIGPLRGDGTRRLVECQRLMILPEYRNKRLPSMPFGVLAALVKGCLHWCICNDSTYIVADLFASTATTPMAQLLALGFTGTGIDFTDTELDNPDRSTALLLRIGELFSRSFRSESPFYRYLIAADEAIDVYR